MDKLYKLYLILNRAIFFITLDTKHREMTVLSPERLLRLAYHYPDLHDTWFLMATATLLELNLTDDIPAILHFALRQQLLDFCSDEEMIVQNEYMLKLAEDSILSSQRCVKMYPTGVKLPDILIPYTYYKKIPLTFKYTNGEDVRRKQQLIVVQMKEVSLKLASMVGLPKVINALTILKSATPSRLVDDSIKRGLEIDVVTNGEQKLTNEKGTGHTASSTASSSPSPSPIMAENTLVGSITTDSVNAKQVKSNLISGSKLWNTVFSNLLSEKIRKQMLNAYPDLWYYVNNHIYAYLLGYNKILTDKKTSLVLVACLVPQETNPQLKGYLKGALNNGATKDEVMSTRNLAIKICDWNEHTWKEGIESVPKL